MADHIQIITYIPIQNPIWVGSKLFSYSQTKTFFPKIANKKNKKEQKDELLPPKQKVKRVKSFNKFWHKKWLGIVLGI